MVWPVKTHLAHSDRGSKASEFELTRGNFSLDFSFYRTN